MVKFVGISCSSIATLLILVDANMFEQKLATINEITNMISTMHRCLTNPIRMMIGVVAGMPCSTETIKALQGSSILGIIPCVTLLGYSRTLIELKTLLMGKNNWSKDLLDVFSGVVTKTQSSTGIALTNRQSQVLALVSNRGLSNKRIAQALNISESTVKIHMSAILKEYGVRNRTQLALVANSSLKA